MFINLHMPKKLFQGDIVPSLVTERLQAWGLGIRTLRLMQKMRAQDLCARMSITHTTLRRLEQGDPGAGAGLYLTAFMILGAMDTATPPLPSQWLAMAQPDGRVRLPKPSATDDDF